MERDTKKKMGHIYKIQIKKKPNALIYVLKKYL